MDQADETRRLAAILAADVVGYSRLMGADESGTLGALKAHLGELIEPVIAARHGRIVKTMGDGFLAEFASVVDAVRCAIEVQNAMPGRNTGVVQERRLEFRIGINVGDVIVEGEDIFGDGVNVAARLEALARPGGICISRTARDQVRDKLSIDLEDLGEQSVKNIARPVRAFQVRLVAPAPAAGREAPALPDKPSIAVLPFDNMSGDPEQEYFSYGIAEDIITDLFKVSGLFVVARNSSFAYKGQSPNIPEVCKDLGVRTVLEGSVRKAGNRVRINAQLIDGQDGGHLWAERFDRDLDDIFAVQDEVTHEIVSALKVQLSPDEEARLGRGGTENLEAHDLFLQARERAGHFTAESSAEARTMLERAVALAPDFAAAYAELALAHARDYVNRWSADPQQALCDCSDVANRALACDDLEPSAHFAAGVAHMWRKEHARATAEAEREIELDPNSAEGYGLLALVADYSGRPEEAIALFDKAMRFNPHYPGMVLHFYGHAHFMMGRYEEAAAIFRQRIEREPMTDASRALLASALGHLGRIDEAREAWRDMLAINPKYSLEHRANVQAPGAVRAHPRGAGQGGPSRLRPSIRDVADRR